MIDRKSVAYLDKKFKGKRVVFLQNEQVREGVVEVCMYGLVSGWDTDGNAFCISSKKVSLKEE